MRSSLYECEVAHRRVSPTPHNFTHSVFMFAFDLDELPDLSKKFALLSYNRANLYSFYDQDYFPDGNGPLKEKIAQYLNANGVPFKNGRVTLLTLPRILGYVFNPVSFYFCWDEKERPLCALVEVTNTFQEMKRYLLKPETLVRNKLFAQDQPKLFYVSPFIGLAADFSFQLELPNEKINIIVDDKKEGKKFLFASLTGNKISLTGFNLFWMSIKYPWLTLKIYTLIHWHALIFYLRGMVHYKKNADNHLQQGMHARRTHIGG